jgi:uncharacterized membrane protein
MSLAGRARPWMRVALALVMMIIGTLHFTAPAFFVSIVPAWLPAPEALVVVSGVFEVLGGVGLLVARVRRAASFGLVALYVAVFPANINMTMHPAELGHGLPLWALWARLPLQAVLIAWALWVGRGDARVTAGITPCDALGHPPGRRPASS